MPRFDFDVDAVLHLLAAVIHGLFALRYGRWL